MAQDGRGRDAGAPLEGDHGARAVGQVGATRWMVLALLLAACAGLKLRYDPAPAGHHRADSTFFYLLGRSVAQGQGLATNVSLYHQGLRDMPAKTNAYPLWPLVLGTAGGLVGMQRAASVLPEVLYLACLLLLFLLASALARERGVGPILRIRGRSWFELGHLAVILFGGNAVFFRATSLCMTEGLAFTLVFACLLALGRARGASPVLWSALAGGLGGLAFLTRSQMIALPLAVVLALALAGHARRRLWLAAGAAALAALLVLVPWLLHLASFVPDFSPRMALDWASYRGTPELAAFTGFVEHDDLASRLADMWQGLLESARPGGEYAYSRSFGWAVYLVPLGLLVLSVALLRGRAKVGRLLAPDNLLGLATFLAAGACLAPVHAFHATFPLDWWFHNRHGLPMILALVLALSAFMARGAVTRGVLTALALTSILANWAPLGDEHPDRRPWPGGGSNAFVGPWTFEDQLIDWLDGHERPPVAVSSACRELALWTDGSYHWFRFDREPSELVSMFEHLELDYLVLYPHDRTPTWRAVRERFERVQRFGEGPQAIAVFRWLGGPDAAEGPAPPGAPADASSD